MEIPQFRDGECEVRRLWDEAVAEAMGWDAAELALLRELLHPEPHVRGLGYGQYAVCRRSRADGHRTFQPTSRSVAGLSTFEPRRWAYL